MTVLRVILVGLLVLIAPLCKADCVILLHGLARSSASMEEMAQALVASGYQVANIDYPSRTKPVEQLAATAIEAGLAQCPPSGTVHFVTHSMGAILLRWYLSQFELARLGRVVMLAPPNQGSEVVDVFGKVPGFAWFNGPAGLQMGTGADSLPLRLPPVDYPTGVIAGTSSINLLLSTVLPNPDDGKVSVANTRVAGMRDHISMPYSHPYIMQRAPVIEQVINFLVQGQFKRQD